jgi:hypothetical protein
VLTLVVDPAIAGSSLGQLPFVVFSADFLAKGWIGHVQDPENKASQMCEVGNTPSGSLHGRIQFYEAENDHKILRRDGDKEVDVNEAGWEKPAKCQKDPINGARSSDHRNKLIRRENDSAEARTDATEQEISQEFSRAPGALELSAKHPQGKEIEEDVRNPPVKEDVSDELPQKEFFPDEKRDQPKVEGDPIVHDPLQKKENGHEDDQFLDHGSQAIAKRESVAIISHSVLQIIVVLPTSFSNVPNITFCFKSFCLGSVA